MTALETCPQEERTNATAEIKRSVLLLFIFINLGIGPRNVGDFTLPNNFNPIPSMGELFPLKSNSFTAES